MPRHAMSTVHRRRSRPLRWALVVLAASVAVIPLQTDPGVADTGAARAPRAIGPVADTYVTSISPETALGSRIYLRAAGGGRKISYLRFDLRGLADTVMPDRIRLYAPADVGPVTVHEVGDDTWSELDTMYANRPRPGAQIAATRPLGAGSWLDVDIRQVRMPDRQVSLAIQSVATGTDAEFASRESATPPVLTLRDAGSGQAEASGPVASSPPTATARPVSPRPMPPRPVPTSSPASATPGAVLAGGTPAAAGPARPSAGDSVLISPAELAARPASGPAWTALVSRADRMSGSPANVSVRGDHNIDVLANALVGARMNDATRKTYVRDELRKITLATRNGGDVLATLRQLQTYVIAADVMQLRTFDPAFDGRFRSWLDAERKFVYSGGGGGGSVISTHNRKPNNFGTHAGASRIAAALYLGDTADLARAADVWRGWATGEPGLLPAGYAWSATSWQADPRRPAGINPKGATRNGLSIGGVIPEDQRRCGEFALPVCSTGYIHGAADGMLLSFEMLSQHGYDAWNWGDQAAFRQYQWKYQVGQMPYGEFRWQIPLVNRAYGTTFPGADPAATGKSFAFAAWLFG